jgi:dihydrofolate reductase
MNHKIYIIAAAEENNGIGKNGKMPWNLKDEMKHFQDTTTKTSDPNKQNMVIMGRTTWYSIPENHRPLKNRKNVVLTRESEPETKGVTFCSSIKDALALADSSVENIFIMGGASVYKQAVESGIADGIFLTRVHREYDCDTFFPEVPKEFGEPVSLGGSEEDDISFDYLFYARQQ